MKPSFMKELIKRDKLYTKILKALEHLPHQQQMIILLANFSTEDLKKFLLFQK
jgi:hypothetical protein